VSAAIDTSGVASQSTATLFEDVVLASGLTLVLARPAVARACLRAGVDPRALDRSSLTRVLPFLESTLRVFVPAEAEARLQALRALLR
jgi:hypothetical protein